MQNRRIAMPADNVQVDNYHFNFYPDKNSAEYSVTLEYIKQGRLGWFPKFDVNNEYISSSFEQLIICEWEKRKFEYDSCHNPETEKNINFLIKEWDKPIVDRLFLEDNHLINDGYRLSEFIYGYRFFERTMFNLIK